MNEEAIEVYSRAEFDAEWCKARWPFLDEGVTPATPIMRFVREDYAFEMFKSGYNTLARTSSWDDVYEGLLWAFNCNADSMKGVIDSYYGQSWTLAKYDSELLWNARSKNKDSLCLQSTVGKLIKSVLRFVNVEHVGKSIRIGKVDYDDQKLIKVVDAVVSLQESVSDIALDSAAMMDYHFTKREAFSDEQEYRLILDGSVFAGECPKFLKVGMFDVLGKTVRYQIDPTDFLTGVLLDPRLTEDEVANVKNRLRETCGGCWKCNGQELSIEQSALYGRPSEIADVSVPVSVRGPDGGLVPDPGNSRHG